MNKHFSRFLFILFFTVSALFFHQLNAAENTTSFTGKYKVQQAEIENLLRRALKDNTTEQQEESRQKLDGFIANYTKQIEILENEIAQLTSALEGITAPEAMSDKAAKMLNDFLSLKQEKELHLVELRMLLLNAEEAHKQLTRQIDKEMAAHLFSRNAPIWSGRNVSTTPIDYQQYQHPLVLILSFLCLLICLVSNSLKKLTPSQNADHPNIITLLARAHSAHSLIGRLILFIIYSVPLALLITGHITDINKILFPVGSAIFFYVAGNWYIPNFYQRLFTLDAPPVSTNMFSLSSSLLIVIGLGGREVFLVPHYAFSALLLFWLFMAALMLRGLLFERFNPIWKGLRALLAILIFTLACLEVIGYTNFIDFIVDAFTASVGTIILASLIYDGIELILAGMVSLKNSFYDRFLYNYSINDSGFETFTVLEIGTKVYLVIGTLVLLAHQWGISQFSNNELSDFFFNGIELGGMPIIPARITIGLILFAICWPLVGFVKELTDRKWLARSGFSASSRDSFLTMWGYIGYAVLIVIVLTVAGVKLTGLTIVIGALSVGIGFGLQNLVNNFISGIILIFERPIKKGDWILVGTTEGYVKDIYPLHYHPDI